MSAGGRKYPQRPTQRGLPYGWWKRTTFWDMSLLIAVGALLTLILAAWFIK